MTKNNAELSPLCDFKFLEKQQPTATDNAHIFSRETRRD
jgi:hypothetical protein